MDGQLIGGALAVALGVFVSVVGVGRSLTSARASGDLLDAISDDVPDLHRAELARPLVERLLAPVLSRLERAVRTVTPAWWLDRIRSNAVLAGLGSWGFEGIFTLKVSTSLAGLVLLGSVSMLTGTGGLGLWGATGAVVGFFLPDVWLAQRADTRQDEIRRDLPEALDLLAIAVGAGMGLEQAIDLVASRLPGALGDELHRMLQEVQLGASRRDALMHLRDRTRVSELSTFVLALAQADALGSPLAEVLRIEAVQMRMLRRQRAREYAAKVPVKLLFPLLLCIFPALVVVIVGPAVVSIIDAFGG